MLQPPTHALSDLYGSQELIEKATHQLSETVRKVVEDAQNEALLIGLRAYNPTLADGIGLEEAKKSFRYTDMGDGDRMVYWAPTNEAIMFLAAPQVDFSEPLKPKGTVGYRVPTWAERQELNRMR